MIMKSEIDAPDLNGLCILIVDDSWDVATGMKMLLESWGADVLGQVATIAEAERLISEQTPNVAIVDITLRGGEESNRLIDRLCEKGSARGSSGREDNFVVGGICVAPRNAMGRAAGTPAWA
jgi:CheY-like chemotaxis protein